MQSHNTRGKTEMVPLASLTPDPANVRRHSERNLDAIKRSLEAFGQQKPVVIGADNVVIAGNGMVEAAVALGWETIEIIRSELRGSVATAYAIADNRTAELADWDDKALADVLESLKLDVDFEDLAAVGFTDKEIELLVGVGENAAPVQEWVGMPEFEQEDEESDSSIRVHFRNPEDRQKFAELVEQPITEKMPSIWYPYQSRGKPDKVYTEIEA